MPHLSLLDWIAVGTFSLVLFYLGVVAFGMRLARFRAERDREAFRHPRAHERIGL